MSRKTMMLKTIALLLIAGLIMTGLTGCFGKKYHVDYGTQKDSFKNAKDYYSAGTKVTLYYDLIATDTDYSFWLDGERLNPDYDEKMGYIIRFTMPEHDVALSVSMVNSMTENFNEPGMKPSYQEKAELSFDSYDGGGPEYAVRIEDPTIVKCEKTIEYKKANHKELDGAGYTVTFTFTGLTPGTTTVTVYADNSSVKLSDEVYAISVNDELKIALTKQAEDISE